MEIAWRDRADPLATPRLTLAGIIGALPIAAYAASNFLLFGSLAPISGRAKELRIHHTFTAVPVKWLLFSLATLPRVLILAPTILLLALALGSLVTRGWKNLPSAYRPIAVALMTFPIIHILALSLTSDWPLFTWYIYSLILAEVGWRPGALRPGIRTAQVLRAGFSSRCGRGSARDYAPLRRRPPSPRKTSRKSGLANLQRLDHQYPADSSSLTPGCMRQGDCFPGMPGYLLQYPVIQLEGLVMDASYLENIQRERNLNQVLQKYGVTYCRGHESDFGRRLLPRPRDPTRPDPILTP